ncbi:MAG: hypothetical protein IPL47_17340 [Phyllobacteriaceae bacterium]|nr:hypothetical protein [Phyllobacteriaceae bacterium]
MIKKLDVSIAGPFGLSFDGKPLRLATRKGEALIGYLAVGEASRVSRSVAASLLWSDVGEELARTSLRQVLRSLRKTFDEIGFAGFDADMQFIWLDKSHVRIDVERLIESIGDGEVPKPSLLSYLQFGEAILQGSEDLDESFGSWVRVQRKLLGDRILSALEANIAKVNGGETGAQWAAAICAFDPTNEPAVRKTMLARASRGDQAGALAAYETLWNLLRDEYDAEPMPETQQAVAAIKLGMVPAAQPEARAIIGDQSLAPILIVEIAAAIESPPPGHLIGMRMELVSLLARFREWIIVDWNPAEIASDREWYRVMLSTWEEGSTSAFNVSFKSGENGRFIWGETVRGGLADFVSTMERHVRHLAAALKIQLSADRLNRAVVPNPLPASLFDRWVKAQQALLQWRYDEDELAKTLLEDITRAAPDFSAAYSALAQYANGRHIVCPGICCDNALLDDGYADALKARQLDPLDAKAYLAIGWNRAMAGEYEESATAFREALALNSADPWNLVSATHGLAFVGEVEELAPLIGRIESLGVSLSAMQWSFMAGIYYIVGDLRRSADAAARGGEGYFGMRVWQVAALRGLRRADEAAAAADMLFASLAQNWKGADPPTPAAAFAWLEAIFPIRDRQTRQRVFDALARSGMGGGSPPQRQTEKV